MDSRITYLKMHLRTSAFVPLSFMHRFYYWYLPTASRTLPRASCNQNFSMFSIHDLAFRECIWMDLRMSSLNQSRFVELKCGKTQKCEMSESEIGSTGNCSLLLSIEIQYLCIVCNMFESIVALSANPSKCSYSAGKCVTHSCANN